MKSKVCRKSRHTINVVAVIEKLQTAQVNEVFESAFRHLKSERNFEIPRFRI